MTTPTEEERREVPFTLQPVMARPQGWRAQSNGFIAVGLVGFVVIGIVLARAFDNGPSSPAVIAAASPTVVPSSILPSTPPAPTLEPLATPLPVREILGGQIPNERRLVNANGLQVLDLATGTLASPARPYQDVLLPLSDDQIVCACVIRGVTGGDGTVSSPGLQFGRYDLAGKPIVERDLLTFDGAVPVPEMTEGLSIVAALGADQRDLLVLAAVRRPPVWTIELHVVDVKSGKLLGSTELDRFPVGLEEPGPPASPRPGGGPPDGVYAWANTLAASPDGRAVYASINFSEVRAENWTNGNHEWMIPMRAGASRSPAVLSAAASLKPDGWCLGQPWFVDPTLMVQVCTPGGTEFLGSSYYVRRVTTAGESLGDLPIPGQQLDGYYPTTAVTDRAARCVFIWDAGRHSLTRVGVDDGAVGVGAVPQSSLPDGRLPSRGSYLGGEPGLVASLDGRRLYAIGLTDGPGPAGAPTGVWVFDAGTLDLVDHWEPRAFLTSLAISADGQFVYAAGAAGFDVEGRENPWPASVTVYDAASGEIQVVYGAVSRDTWVTFPALP